MLLLIICFPYSIYFSSCLLTKLSLCLTRSVLWPLFISLSQPLPAPHPSDSGRRTERKGWKNSPRRRRLGKKREPKKAWERIFGGELRAKQGERCLGTLQGMREAESEKKGFKNGRLGASLVAQWLRVCLPMQGTRVRALVWEDPICRGATRPVSHNY